MAVFQQDNPFRPGRGGMPPYLAGRKFEQGRMRKCLLQTASKQPPARNLVLIGPRGNGKTVLLNWFELEGGTANVDVVRRTPDQLPDLESLADALVPPSRISDLIPKDVKVSWEGIVGVKWAFKANETPYAQALAARCKKRPVLMMVDEAHTLEPSVARVLLNLSQTLHNEQCPFLLALAGTPGLEHALRKANSTFLERCETLGVDRLSPEATIQAVVEPFGARDILFDREVVDQIPETTQNYPYFAATFGDELWEALAREGSETVSMRTAEAATDSYDKGVRVFYSRRHSELEDAELLDAARAVARKFAQYSQWDRYSLLVAIKGAQGVSNPESTFNALRDLGFVWRAPGEILYAAGIPSLMNFIERPRSTRQEQVRPAR